MNPGPTGRPQSKLMYRLGYGLGILFAVFLGVVLVGAIVKTIEWALP